MNIVYSVERGSKTVKCEKHSHDVWEVILNLKGDVKTEIDGEVYYIKPGDVVAIPPNTEHSESSDNIFSDMYFKTDKLDLRGVTVVHDFDKSIYNLMNMLQKCYLQKEKGHLLIGDSLVNTIVLYIKKNLDSSNHIFVEKLKKTIYENISNSDFSLAEQINNSGYNADYLRRVFKKETKMTPLEYLVELRMKKARTLLLQDNFISVKEVANQCGFKDSFYFSTCFKKFVNSSPLRYRKTNCDGRQNNSE